MFKEKVDLHFCPAISGKVLPTAVATPAPATGKVVHILSRFYTAYTLPTHQQGGISKHKTTKKSSKKTFKKASKLHRFRKVRKQLILKIFHCNNIRA